MGKDDILKELEKVAERMARGWESEWKLKEIYQLILTMDKKSSI